MQILDASRMIQTFAWAKLRMFSEMETDPCVWEMQAKTRISNTHNLYCVFLGHRFLTLNNLSPLKKNMVML